MTLQWYESVESILRRFTFDLKITQQVKVNELKIAVKQGNAEFPEREEVVSGKKDWSFAGIKGTNFPELAM